MLCIAFEFQQLTPYSFTLLRFSVRSIHLAIPAILADTFGVYFGGYFSSLQVKHNDILIPCSDICISWCHPLLCYCPRPDTSSNYTYQSQCLPFLQCLIRVHVDYCLFLYLTLGCLQNISSPNQCLIQNFGNVIKEHHPTPLLDYKNNIYFF